MGFANSLKNKISRVLQEFMESREDEAFFKASADLLATSFENPTRIGCPDPAMLRKISMGRLPLKDATSLMGHLGTCSECFQDYRRCRHTFERQKIIGRSVVAAMTFLMLGAGMLLFRRNGRSQQSSQILPVSALNTLRLQVVPTIRSSQKAIRLPLDGPNPGRYKIELITPEGKKLRESKGVVVLEQPSPILKFKMDLSGLPSGRYLLRLQEQAGDILIYAVQLK
jgi:hypothetical protein